jgi:Fe-S-cluster containining protein
VTTVQDLYDSVPDVNCKGLCHQACRDIGPQITAEEKDRLAARGVDIEKHDDGCPALVDKRCSVYEDRPLICRLFGATKRMRCPWGCEPVEGQRRLTDAEEQEILRKARTISGGAAYPQYVGVRQPDGTRVEVLERISSIEGEPYYELRRGGRGRGLVQPKKTGDA